MDGWHHMYGISPRVSQPARWYRIRMIYGQCRMSSGDVTLSQPDDVTTVAISSGLRIPNADGLGQGGMWSEWVTTISGNHEDIIKPLPGHLGSIFKNCSTPGGASAILYIQMQLYNFFTENVSLPWLKLAPSVACSLLLITGIAANSARSWDNNHASHLLLRKLLEIEC